MTDTRSSSWLVEVMVGFGTAVAMWAIGYVCRIPPVLVPAPVILVLLLVALIGGGFLAARHGTRGLASALAAGCVAGLINLLIVGGVLGDGSGADAPSLLLWMPASIVGSMLIAALGGLFAGGADKRTPMSTDRALELFGRVAIVAVFFTVIAGGLVTSYEAGLDVPDWPHSFGVVMFLFPLAKMTGGIYYEHAHRLYGMLIGLTTVVLALSLYRHEARAWVKKLSYATVVMVIVQGLMGGVRVTGSFTLAERPPTEPNTALAIAHGIFGQVFFMTMVILAVVLSRSWRQAHTATQRKIKMALPLVAVLLVQLSLGAIARHLSTDETPLHMAAMIHMTLAIFVGVKAIVVGVQARTSAECHPWIQTLGAVIVGTVVLQILLGVAAMVGVLLEGEKPTAMSALAATAHQANGALLLGAAGALWIWSKRPLLLPEAPPPTLANADTVVASI